MSNKLWHSLLFSRHMEFFQDKQMKIAHRLIWYTRNYTIATSGLYSIENHPYNSWRLNLQPPRIICSIDSIAFRDLRGSQFIWPGRLRSRRFISGYIRPIETNLESICRWWFLTRPLQENLLLWMRCTSVTNKTDFKLLARIEELPLHMERMNVWEYSVV